MIRVPRGLRVLVIAFPALLFVSVAVGKERLPSAAEVTRKVRERFARIEDYRVRVWIEVDIEGFEFPDQEITLLFKRPDRVHFEGIQFAMLPREAVMADPSQLLDEDRFHMEVAGADTLGDRGTYELRLCPKERAEGAAGELAVWVDAQRWVILRMEAYDAGKKQGLVVIEHGLIDDRFWLPRRTDVEIYMENRASPPTAEAERDSTASARQPEKGTIHLTFRDYEVNIGLPDSLFVAAPPRGLER